MDQRDLSGIIKIIRKKQKMISRVETIMRMEVIVLSKCLLGLMRGKQMKKYLSHFQDTRGIIGTHAHSVAQSSHLL
ncbi:hypothetical protein V1477_005762 [Vespula maculifrons]|uniref:Uncharacterized protein n=1 Tax=Vespula maculifrons TaxID=7453 RepID=A0ABD2CLX9_VESMC